jgi:osmoprotectant transport system permease protein
MDLAGAVWAYWGENSARFWQALGTHLTLSGAALALALLLAVPLGIGTARWGRAGRWLIQGVGLARVVPSLGVLLLLLPILGTGFPPSLVALTLLAIPPILINTDAGLRGVAPAVLEAAHGMGYGAARLLGEVQGPLALPVVLAGVRTAAVEVIASATLASFIGGGGLGEFILAGLALSRPAILLAGALPIAALALTAEALLAALQRTARRRLT